jgi:hypothetical protein
LRAPSEIRAGWESIVLVVDWLGGWVMFIARLRVSEVSRNIGPESATGRSPRKLSTHQQAVLIQVLLAFPDEPVGVCYLPATSDASAYAEDFLNIFKAINWAVDRVETVANFPFTSCGLAIVTPEKQLPPSAEALRDSLRIYGIEAEIIADPGNLCASRTFVLVVT